MDVNDDAYELAVKLKSLNKLCNCCTFAILTALINFLSVSLVIFTYDKIIMGTIVPAYASCNDSLTETQIQVCTMVFFGSVFIGGIYIIMSIASVVVSAFLVWLLLNGGIYKRTGK